MADMTTGTMTRWTVSAHDIATLQPETLPVPAPGPGEVLVKIGAVALNYRDKMVVETGMGLPLRLPVSPASDMAGQVLATGAGVSRFKTGDRVIAQFIPDWIDGRRPGTAWPLPLDTLAGTMPGLLATHAVLPEAWLVAAPSTLDDAGAATLPVAGLTAWMALVEYGRIRAGDTVLVQGTGGVALFGLQIARAHGARVLVTSGSADKLAQARQLGADHGIDRTAGDWAEAAVAATGGRGVDHLLEVAGGAGLGTSLRAIAPGGRISVIGVLDGAEISANVKPLLTKAPVIQGIAVGHRRALEDFVRAVDMLGLKPVIARRYRPDAIREAFAHLDRGPFGKLVIEMD